MRIVAFGDSVTFGQHLDAELAWPQVLARLTGWQVINRGVCGDTTRLALERFARDVPPFHPHVVVIQFGLNDCNRWADGQGLPRVTLPAFRANLEEIVARSRLVRNAIPVLVGLTPCTAQTLSSPARYTGQVRRAARETGALFYQPDVDRSHLLDHVHLNADGQERFANGIRETLCRASSTRPRSSIPTYA